MTRFKDLTEKTLESREIYNGEMVHIFSDTIMLPNGKKAHREYIKHIGAVAVVPVTEDWKVVMERQYRYPVARVVTEIPAGKLNDPSEDFLEAAKRELKEETGVEAEEWIYMGDYHPAVSYTDECIHLFLAKDLSFGDQNLDEDEFLNVDQIPILDLLADIMAGRITDGKTQTAILKAVMYMQKGS